jgi:hypothetical protein
MCKDGNITHLLYLDSEQGYEYPSGRTSRFRNDIEQNIIIGPEQKAYVSVRLLELPNTSMTISASLGNNTFLIKINGGVDQLITIYDGTYSGNELRTEMSTQILSNAIISASLGAGTINIFYGSEIVKFEFQNNTVTNYVLTFDNILFGDFIGYNDPTPIAFNANARILSPDIANLYDNNTIELRTNLNLYNNFSNKARGRTNVLEMFPRGPTGEKSYFSNSNDTYRSQIRNSHISDIEVWLTDKNGELDLGGVHWKVILLLEIVNM